MGEKEFWVPDGDPIVDRADTARELPYRMFREQPMPEEQLLLLNLELHMRSRRWRRSWSTTSSMS